jgi:hypothetical protein
VITTYWKKKKKKKKKKKEEEEERRKKKEDKNNFKVLQIKQDIGIDYSTIDYSQNTQLQHL